MFAQACAKFRGRVLGPGLLGVDGGFEQLEGLTEPGAVGLGALGRELEISQEREGSCEQRQAAPQRRTGELEHPLTCTAGLIEAIELSEAQGLGRDQLGESEALGVLAQRQELGAVDRLGEGLGGALELVGALAAAGELLRGGDERGQVARAVLAREASRE